MARPKKVKKVNKTAKKLGRPKLSEAIVFLDSNDPHAIGKKPKNNEKIKVWKNKSKKLGRPKKIKTNSEIETTTINSEINSVNRFFELLCEMELILRESNEPVKSICRAMMKSYLK
jgi:hypothetical protein